MDTLPRDDRNKRNFLGIYKINHSIAGLSPLILIGCIIGWVLITMPILYTSITIFGIILIIISINKPELSILTIVALVSSIIFVESLPLFPIGVGSLHVPDILLLFLFGLTGYRYVSATNRPNTKSPLGKPLAIFLLVATLSAFVSIAYLGLDFNRVMRTFRSISYYAIFYLVTNLITTKRQVKFMITGLLFIAVAVAVTMFIQTAIGDSVQLMPGRIEAASTFGNISEALRILPPGETLIYLSFITAICLAVFQLNKSLLLSGNFYLVVILGGGIILTYNRNYWVACLLGISFLLWHVALENKRRLLALLTGSAIIFALLVAVLGGSGGKVGKTFSAASDRLLSLFAGKELIQSSSLEYRYLENGYAIRQIVKHPILGLGLSNDYRPEIYAEDKITYYVHNGYLWIMKDMGLLGFSFFMWFYLGFLVRGFRNWKNINDDYFKSVVVGFTLGGLGILPMALVNPIFMQWHSIVVLAVMIGLSETIIRILEKEQNPYPQEVPDIDG